MIFDDLEEKDGSVKEVKFQQTMYVQSLNLPQGGKILHEKYPCVRDKCHICTQLSFKNGTQNIDFFQQSKPL